MWQHVRAPIFFLHLFVRQLYQSLFNGSTIHIELTIVHMINSLISYLPLIVYTSLIIARLYILVRSTMHMQSRRFRFILHMQVGSRCYCENKNKIQKKYIYCGLAQFLCILNSLHKCTLFFKLFIKHLKTHERDVVKIFRNRYVICCFLAQFNICFLFYLKACLTDMTCIYLLLNQLLDSQVWVFCSKRFAFFGGGSGSTPFNQG